MAIYGDCVQMSLSNTRIRVYFVLNSCFHQERVSTGHLVLPRILSPASPRILLLPDVFLLSNKIRGDAGDMRGNLQNAVNQEVAYHKVPEQVARALPYGLYTTPNEFCYQKPLHIQCPVYIIQPDTNW